VTLEPLDLAGIVLRGAVQKTGLNRCIIAGSKDCYARCVDHIPPSLYIDAEVINHMMSAE